MTPVIEPQPRSPKRRWWRILRVTVIGLIALVALVAILAIGGASWNALATLY